MKFLILLLLIFITPVHAEERDIYYCDMTKFIGINNDGVLSNYKLEPFMFEVKSDDKVIEFDEKGYFRGALMPIRINGMAAILAQNNFSTFSLVNRVARYVSASSSALAMTANCSKS